MSAMAADQSDGGEALRQNLFRVDGTGLRQTLLTRLSLLFLVAGSMNLSL